MSAVAEKEKKKIKLGTVLRNNIYLFRMACRYAPRYVFLCIFEGVFQGITNAIGIYYTKFLFDRLEEGASFSSTIGIVIFMTAYYLIFYLFHYWYWHIQNKLENKNLQYRMHSELFRKACALDLSRYDDPEFYNDFIWSIRESDTRVDKQLLDIGKLVNRVVASVLVTGLLFTIHPVLAALILVFTLLRIVFQSISAKLAYEKDLEMNPLDRKTDYINRMFRLADCAKEIRLSHVKDSLLEEYEKTIEEKKVVIRRYAKKQYGFATATWVAMNLGDGLVMLFLLYQLLVTHTIELGSFAAGVNATWQLSWLLRDLMDRIVKSKEHALYVEKLRMFLSYEPKIVGGTEIPEPFESLSVRNISFAYGDKVVLEHVSFDIRKGEKVAFVGYNGAGKTTLIKLLMRLYDPIEGEILYNGKNIKQYDLSAYREHIGAVFQDYKIFAATVAENVLGNEYTEDKRDIVLTALKKSTFSDRLDTMEKGIDTELTREFYQDGTNLSGGEAQKIAIARVFARSYDLIVMDEPSSALDPISEYNLNQSILHSAGDKTVLFISHRLSTTRHADIIYMFEKGRIIESGSHEKLMDKNGKYAYMFRLQAEKYCVDSMTE